MKIWIDADACPREIKQIVFKASRRLQIPVVLVANDVPPAPASPLVSAISVPRGFHEADDYIAETVLPGEIVVTADIPLAAKIVGKGAVALDPRGELYTEHNVGERLSMRDLLMDLRAGGLVQGGPSPLRPSDKHKFAAALDRLLALDRRSRNDHDR